VGAHLQSTGSARGAPWGAEVVIGGRYRLISPLGAGAMGEVWRGEHVTLGAPAAVKLVDLTAQQDPQEALGRFLQEARAAAGLRSPHVVQILDHGAEGRIAYIAMELLEGESLAARLARRKHLAPEEILKVVREVALAIDKAHAQKILHRDLKPANVFFAQAPGGEIVKVLDFGIAKVIGAEKRDAIVQTQAGLVMGTPAYMSPEQVLGQPLDERSDLWQLGVIAFECACGDLPFHGAALGDLFVKICSGKVPVPSSRAPVPPGFDAWFARAVHRNAAERFGSALELASALEPVLAPNPAVISGAAEALTSSGIRRGTGAAPPEGAPEGVEPAVEPTVDAPPPDRRSAVWIGALAGVAVAAIAVWLAVTRTGERRDPAPEPSLTFAAHPPAELTADPVTPAPAPPRAAPSTAPEAPAEPTATPTGARSGRPPARAPQPQPRSREREVEEDLGL
jgi:serine/threonine-protein kinase